MHLNLLKAIGVVSAPCLLAVTLASVGCGSGSEASSGTSTISFKSPAVRADGVIRSSTSCGAGSLWLPLRWGPVPSGTKELAVYIGRFKYKKVHGTRKLVVPFADLVSHIDPSVRQIPANTIPEGAEWSYFGKTSCPPARTGQNVLQEVFALDRTRTKGSLRELNPRLATRLTEEALSGDDPSSSSRSAGTLTEDAAAIGLFTATYGP